MDADNCAYKAIDGLLKRKDVHVPCAINRVFTIVTKMAPRGLVAAQIAKLYEGSLEK